MSEEIDRENNPESNLWRKKHLFELLAAGIPETIAENHHDWTYTLLHAEHFPTGWNLDWISADEMKQLHALLPPPSETQVGLTLIHELGRRIKADDKHKIL